MNAKKKCDKAEKQEDESYGYLGILMVFTVGLLLYPHLRKALFVYVSRGALCLDLQHATSSGYEEGVYLDPQDMTVYKSSKSHSISLLYIYRYQCMSATK